MKNIVTSFRRRGMVFFCAIALAAVGGLTFVCVFTACDNGNGSSSTGTFRIRVTGIPSDVMTAGQNGYILIGIGPANNLQATGSNALAGRDTDYYASDDNFGVDWYEFFLYNLQGTAHYVGSAGNYDIGFTNSSSVKILRNRRLEVNTTNTIAYSLFSGGE